MLKIYSNQRFAENTKKNSKGDGGKTPSKI
jgi:hypothetical protein